MPRVGDTLGMTPGVRDQPHVLEAREELHELVDELSEDEVIKAVGRVLSEAAPQARVILFGSHARGEAGKHSDLDLLVIEPSVENPARESVRLRRALGNLVLAADVIVVSEQRVEEWRDVRGSLIHVALAEGRELAA
jgi:uncharacterized protein